MRKGEGRKEKKRRTQRRLEGVREARSCERRKDKGR